LDIANFETKLLERDQADLTNQLSRFEKLLNNIESNKSANYESLSRVVKIEDELKNTEQEQVNNYIKVVKNNFALINKFRPIEIQVFISSVSSLCFILFVLGVKWCRDGFRDWYEKLQKYQDEIIRNEATESTKVQRKSK